MFLTEREGNKESDIKAEKKRLDKSLKGIRPEIRAVGEALGDIIINDLKMMDITEEMHRRGKLV